MMQDWLAYLPIAGVLLVGACVGFLFGYLLEWMAGKRS